MEDAGTAQTAFISPPADSWFGLGRRLAAAFWLVGSATYCRDEWPQPSDDCIDTDPDTHHSGGEPEQEGRRLLGALAEDEYRNRTQPSRKRGGRSSQQEDDEVGHSARPT